MKTAVGASSGAIGIEATISAGRHVLGPGEFRVRASLSLATASARTHPERLEATTEQPYDGCADAPNGTLGPSHGYFGLVRGAQLQLLDCASDISLSCSFSGQLSVFSICSRSLQHVLQSFLRLHITVRWMAVIEGIFTRSLSRRICCSSFRRVLFFIPFG